MKREPQSSVDLTPEKAQTLLGELETQMQHAATQLWFERAAILRDQIGVLKAWIEHPEEQAVPPRGTPRPVPALEDPPSGPRSQKPNKPNPEALRALYERIHLWRAMRDARAEEDARMTGQAQMNHQEEPEEAHDDQQAI